jgi:hypothetical protein
MFTSDSEQRRTWQCQAWNARFAGKPAFNTPTANGYHLAGCIFNERHLAHCVIWAMIHGRWPVLDVDHADGDGHNNRPRNLQHKSHSGNMKNSKRSTINKSGAVGVYWHAGKANWQAQINHSGRRIHLGNFCTFEAARDARKAAELQYGFHPNHGRAAV